MTALVPADPRIVRARQTLAEDMDEVHRERGRIDQEQEAGVPAAWLAAERAALAEQEQQWQQQLRAYMALVRLLGETDAAEYLDDLPE